MFNQYFPDGAVELHSWIILQEVAGLREVSPVRSSHIISTTSSLLSWRTLASDTAPAGPGGPCGPGLPGSGWAQGRQGVGELGQDPVASALKSTTGNQLRARSRPTALRDISDGHTVAGEVRVDSLQVQQFSHW